MYMSDVSHRWTSVLRESLEDQESKLPNGNKTERRQITDLWSYSANLHCLRTWTNKIASHQLILQVSLCHFITLVPPSVVFLRCLWKRRECFRADHNLGSTRPLVYPRPVFYPPPPSPVKRKPHLLCYPPLIQADVTPPRSFMATAAAKYFGLRGQMSCFLSFSVLLCFTFFSKYASAATDWQLPCTALAATGLHAGELSARD